MNSDDTLNVNEALEPEKLLTLQSYQHVLTDVQEKRCRVSAAEEEHTPVATAESLVSGTLLTTKGFGLLCYAIVYS
jgi:hypothetical protein